MLVEMQLITRIKEGREIRHYFFQRDYKVLWVLQTHRCTKKALQQKANVRYYINFEELMKSGIQVTKTLIEGIVQR